MQKLTACLLLLPALALAGDWKLEHAEVDLEAVDTLYQASANSIKDEYAKSDVNPVLAFACRPGDPQVTAQIDWQRFISSFSTEVGFKVDDGKFTWLKWKVDGSEKITRSPSADDTQKLVELLAAGNRLLVEISPYSEGPVTVEFDLAGFADSMDALTQSCQ